jgi:hypothetical protein
MNKNSKEKNFKDSVILIGFSLMLLILLYGSSGFSLAFEPLVLPPTVVMKNSGLKVAGHLLAYEFRQGETFSQLNNPNESLSIKIPSTDTIVIGKVPKTITLGLNDTMPISLDNKSRLNFIVQNVPNGLSPKSLYVTAYAINPIRPIKVLKVDNSSQNFFILNLPRGSYILLASLTWEPSNEEKVTGFAYYSWNVKLNGF